MKVAWDLFINPSKLCSQVLISKYAAPCYMITTDVSFKNGSYLWRSMGRIWKDFQKGLRWSIGNGQRVKFWDDIWATNGDPLINYTVASIPVSMRNMLVADCVDQNGNWLWNRFNSFLNNHAVLRIASMAPPSSMRGEDRMYWGASNSGNFTVQTAYQVLTNFCPAEDCQDWQQLWKWKGPQSVRMFLWLLCHDRLKTGCELARRHLDVEALCGRCHADVENSLHAIRDCGYSRGVWRKLIPAPRQHDFFSYPLRQWIMTNLRRRVSDMGSLFWPVMFGIAAWRIWYWRNQVMFNNKSWNDDLIVRDIKARAESICSTLSSAGFRRNERIQKWIRWAPPPWPFLCLNTDGARKGNGEASAGGLLRDCHGNFIHGFSAHLGVCSVLKAELWGVLHGLRMAWDLGYRRIQVGIDNCSVVQIIKENNAHVNETSNIIEMIRELMRRDWRIQMAHIYREANSAADFLSTHALSLPVGVHFLRSAPLGLRSILYSDMYGVAHPRFVPL